MRLTPTYLMLVPLTLLAVAGCVGGDSDSTPSDADAPSDAAPAEFDDSTGAIAGLVLDDEARPLTGAQVAVLGLDVEPTLSDASGRFTLSNVPPGTHTLSALRLGYETASKSVDVALGAVSEVVLELEPIPVPEPYAESLPHNGIISTHIAFIRSVQPLPGGNTWMYFGGYPDDFAGLMVEARWESTDYLAFDLVSRKDVEEGGGVWYRTRSQSPLQYLVEPCGDYTGEPHYGRQVMPCTLEEFQAVQGDDGDSAHLETFYAGQYEREAHALDPVCRTGTPYWPAYEAGCYGVGVGQELRWTTWVTIFHMELPPDAEAFSAFPDA